jgi:hypothetical protein
MAIERCTPASPFCSAPLFAFSRSDNKSDLLNSDVSAEFLANIVPEQIVAGLSEWQSILC